MVTTTAPTVLDDIVTELVARRTIRHAVLAIESDDRTLRLTGAAGQARPDGTPMRPETPFHYASVTKLYTATVVMQLWEQGRLGLDAPITAYLPPEVTDGLHRLRGVDHSGAVTVRHLLSHTSGLPDYFLDTPEGETSFTDLLVQGDIAYDLDDVVARVRRLTPYFTPQDPGAKRRRARYSDTNFQLLGAIIASVTGTTFQQAVEGQVLEPLALDDTWFAGRPRGEEARTPAAIWSGDDVIDAPLAMASMAPEGGLVGTAADALTFLRALIAGRLFERETTAGLMQQGWTRFGLPRDRSAIMAPGWPIEYGLGIKRFRLPRMLNAGRRAPTLIGHTGASGSWLFWCPEHELYLAGTIDQTTAAGLPYQRLPRAVHRLHTAPRHGADRP
jgi:D-alanyl-D-alanine carboxypeptidase